MPGCSRSLDRRAKWIEFTRVCGATLWRVALMALVPAVAPAAALGQTATRAIVLAWDGTVPAFAREMVRAGKLPNLAKLIEGGALADNVVPVFPSKTAPGFAALITGTPPNLNGISGNRVPRAPRDRFTMLDSLAGFSAAPLRAETLWAAARRAGKRSVVSHIPTFAGEQAEDTVRFSGYTLIAGRDGVVTGKTAHARVQKPWSHSPPSAAVPLEIRFRIGRSDFFGLLIDDPGDDHDGYDTLVLATARDGQQITSRLKPAPPRIGGEFFWSRPIPLRTAKDQSARSYFRLFDLRPDGSDFFLYYTRPVRDLPLDDARAAPPLTVRTFVGNGAAILLQQGALGPTVAKGGTGIAEARYLETLGFAQHQLAETHRWAMENLPWDLFFAYTPFPDEAEHLWRGHLDTSLSTFRKDFADRVRPLLERAYRSSDELLGVLLDRRPPDALFVLISDHGLQGINRRVALNRVLLEAGLLVLDSQGRVDLTKTKILYPAVNNGYLLINSTDRKNGIVGSEEREELTRRTRALLLALRDGDRPVVKAVYDARAGEAAMGLGGETGGDIYVELAPGYDFDPRIAAARVVSETSPYGSHGTNPAQPAMRTLMVFNGPGIQAGQTLRNVRIIDFAPTLAWLLSFPAPKDATGRVLFEVLAGGAGTRAIPERIHEPKR